MASGRFVKAVKSSSLMLGVQPGAGVVYSQSSSEHFHLRSDDHETYGRNGDPAGRIRRYGGG